MCTTLSYNNREKDYIKIMTDMKMHGKFKEIQQALSLENERKIIWASTRSFLEIDDYKHRRNGGKRKSYWTLFERFLHVFSFFIKAAGLYEKGRNNALNIVVNKIQIEFLNLPDSFNGYKILHLTDLHLDSTKGVEDAIIKKIENLEYDLCVMTGDYRNRTHGNFKQILPPMEKLVKTINSKDGILAVLGNHDTYQLVNYMEEMGIRVLTNETVTIYREGEYIAVTGIDDPSNYYTEQITATLEEKTRDFILSLPLFDAFKMDDLDILARHMNYTEVKRGEYLFMEGDRGDFMCFVVRGLLDVLKRSSDGDFRVIARLGKGNTIGEMSIVDKSPRSASVIARQPSVAIILTKKGFEILTERHPALGVTLLKKILRLLSLNMRRTSSRLADTMTA